MNENIKKQIIKKRLKEKKGYKLIAKELKLGPTTVSKILIENGITDHIKMPNDETVNKIIELYEKGFNMKKIQAELKMGQSRIASILRIKGISIVKPCYHIGYETKVDHNYFQTIDTEHKAYWLGFLYADGYNNEKTYQIELTLNEKDSYMINNFKRDLKANYKIIDKTVELNGTVFNAKKIIIYSKKMSQDLKEKGCMQNKSLKINFPDTNAVPEHLIHHFMRGYFDGDGCICKGIFNVLGTKAFLEKYEKIIRENVDISPAGRYNNNGRAYGWTHTSKKDAILIHDFLYKDATIYLKRKKDRFMNLKFK